jgi:carbamoyl-phosphate synthase large subunit
MDSASIRQSALAQGVPYYTTMSGMRAAIQAIRALKLRPLEAGALQTYS